MLIHPEGIQTLVVPVFFVVLVINKIVNNFFKIKNIIISINIIIIVVVVVVNVVIINILYCLYYCLLI